MMFMNACMHFRSLSKYVLEMYKVKESTTIILGNYPVNQSQNSGQKYLPFVISNSALCRPMKDLQNIE